MIFGSNIGTTTTAWIVSSFGVKIKIAHYAMPMLIFGVVFRFNSNKSYQGFGNVLVGLGFVFLGIGYMKEGFESLKSGLDLAQFAIDGYLGVLVYIFIGAVATVVIQSSSATMALIITALATGQIEYTNALALAIGANIGTTVTAIIGSLSSNANGKRLAVAHFIFNIVTGMIAIVFLYQLADIVDYLSISIGIGSEDYAMKLALFHTIFNVIGVLAVSPFTGRLVIFLKGLFVEEKEDVQRAKYLDNIVSSVPEAAIKSLQKEVSHLFDDTTDALIKAISLDKNTIYNAKENELANIVRNSTKKIDINTYNFYDKEIKYLYSDIISFASIAQEKMTVEQSEVVYSLKVACRQIVETIKDSHEIQKNITLYMNAHNEEIKEEYNFLRINIAKTLNGIYLLRSSEDELDVLADIKLLEESLQKLDMMRNGKIDKLIRKNKIEPKMATSLINDSAFAYDISKKLLSVAYVLWIQDKELQELGEEI